MTSFLIVILFYTYSHYCFASVMARISAMYAAFVAVAAACGTPALMAALTFGFFANCPISLTHYGNGCAPLAGVRVLRKSQNAQSVFKSAIRLLSCFTDTAF